MLGHVLRHVPGHVLKHVPDRHVPGHVLKHVPEHVLGTCSSTYPRTGIPTLNAWNIGVGFASEHLKKKLFSTFFFGLAHQ